MTRDARPVAALIGLFLALACTVSLASPASGQAGGGPTQVGVVTIDAERVPFTVTVPGRAVAFEEVEIRPRVGGVISDILYEAGRQLERGDPMFRIEGDTFEADVAAAQAEVDRAEAALTAAQANLSRYQRLEGVGATTQDVETAQVTVQQSEAELSSARAALQIAELNLQWTEIASPITGLAEVSDVSQGTVVTANQTEALTTVTRIDPIYVDIEESSKRIAEVRQLVELGTLEPGDSFDVRLQLETGQEYDNRGEIVSPGTRVSPTTGTTQFRIRFDNPERRILPGQFLRVQLDVGTTQAVLVPQRATSRAADGTLTAFAAVDGHAEERILEERGSYQNAWIVTEGMQGGESLIVDGLTNLTAGAEVEPVAVEISEDGVVTTADGQSEAFRRIDSDSGQNGGGN